MSDAALPWPLVPGEVVLWQGRPSPGLHVPPETVGQVGRGLIGLGIFVYLAWRLRLPQAPEFGVLVAILAVLFLSVPLGVLRDAALRARSHYALTDRRALIAVDLPVYGRHLRAIPVGRDTPVEYRQGRLSSLRFGRTPGVAGRIFGRTAPPGFERIADGAQVFELIGRMQRAQS